MFFRVKKSGPRAYLQIVANHWRDGAARQQVVATLGRLDQLQTRGQVDALLASGARFADKVLVLAAQRAGRLPVIRTHRIGPPLIFERLWEPNGCPAVLHDLLAQR